MKDAEMKIRVGALLLSLLLCSCAFAQEGSGDSPLYDLPDGASAEGAATDGVLSASEPASYGALAEFDANQDEVSERIDEQLDSTLGVFSGTCAQDPAENFDFVVPTMLALLVIGMGIAIFYMAGNFLGSPQLIAMSKQELFELIHTALIVVLFALLLRFADQLIFSGSGGSSIYDVSLEYSLLMIHKITKDTMWLSLINTLIYMLYSAPLRLGGSLHHAVHFNLGGVLKPFVDAVGTMASLLSFAIGEWIANISVLCFIKRFVPNLFLPIGVLLKAFPQTRGGGNAVIAICIAFFLIYPVMLYMNHEAYLYKYGAIGERSGLEEIVSAFMVETGWLNLSFYAFFLWLFTGQLVGIAFLTQFVVFFIDMLSDVIYTVFVLSIFLPLMNIFVTLTFAREIAKYFGTEINIAAFVRLI
ncbi:hypothetical protein JW721_02700 [Candidatus Micrarchaeota archaeon]|nr:hypothetical protein [Candidatus Micrarchaeota archaeon]